MEVYTFNDNLNVKLKPNLKTEFDANGRCSQCAIVLALISL